MGVDFRLRARMGKASCCFATRPDGRATLRLPVSKKHGPGQGWPDRNGRVAQRQEVSSCAAGYAWAAINRQPPVHQATESASRPTCSEDTIQRSRTGMPQASPIDAIKKFIYIGVDTRLRARMGTASCCFATRPEGRATRRNREPRLRHGSNAHYLFLVLQQHISIRDRRG